MSDLNSPIPSASPASEARAGESWWRSARVQQALTLAIASSAICGVIWWEFFHPYVRTDDARIAATAVAVAPTGAGGNVTELYVDVGSRVTRGQELLKLDSRNAAAQLQRAAAMATLAEQELRRVRRQVREGCSPQSDLDTAECQAQTAQANLELARLALDDTVLISTIDGVVVQKLTEIGNMLEPGQTAITVVDIDNAWVAANIEETYAGRLRIDQPVSIAIDEGGRLRGRIGEILSTTAAQFALIPSDNGSGNYTKVVQRIPIKILLTAPPSGPLRVGQSVEVKIRTRA